MNLKCISRTLITMLLIVCGVLVSDHSKTDVYAAASGTWNECSWELDDEGTLQVHGGEGDNAQSYYSPWYNYKDDIKKVIMGSETEKIVFATNSGKIFNGLDKVISIEFVNVDTSGAQGMADFFRGCSSLTEIKGLDKFDTSKVDDFQRFFENCSSLKEVDLSSFSTAGVTKDWKMDDMFSGNTSLVKVIFGDAFVIKSNDMVFKDEDAMWVKKGETVVKCRGNELASKAMAGDFSLAGTWEYDDRTYWGTCVYSIEDGVLKIGAGTGAEGTDYPPDIPWYTDRNTITSVEFEKGVILPENCNSLFWGAQKLESIDFSNVDMSKVKSTRSMFSSCYSLSTVNLNSTVEGGALKPKDVYWMFYWCTALTSIDFGNFDTSDVTDFSGMFDTCSSLNTLDISGLSFDKATNMNRMFANTKLKSIDLSGVNNTNEVDMGGLFSYSYTLTNIKLPAAGIKASNLSYTFSDCNNLSSIDNLDKLDGTSATSLDKMFRNCSTLTSIDLSKLSAANFTSYRNMFSGCSNLVSLDLTGLDCGKITAGKIIQISSNPITYGYAMDGMFDGCDMLDKIVVGDKWCFAGGVADDYYDVSDTGLPVNTKDAAHQYQWYVTEPGNTDNSGWKNIYSEIPKQSIDSPAYRIYRRTEDAKDPEIPELINFGVLDMNSNVPESFEYTGDVITPNLNDVKLYAVIDGVKKELIKDTDYTVVCPVKEDYIYSALVGDYYVGSTHPVYFYGKGKYTGLYKVYYEIVESSKKDIENGAICKVTWPEDMTCTYTGSECKPRPVSVKAGDKDLVEGTDYEISYYKNINPLQVKYTTDPPRVIILGKGEYTGNVNKAFSINERNINDEGVSVSLNKTSYTYTGSAIKPGYTDLTVTFNGMELEAGDDYIIDEYGNNTEITEGDDKAYVEIKGTGNYTGYRKIYFSIEAGATHTVTIIDELKGNKVYENVPEGKRLYKVLDDTDYNITRMSSISYMMGYDGYYQYNGYSLVNLANKPKSSYADCDALYEDSMVTDTNAFSATVTDDMTLYAIWFKNIEEVEATLESPVCGEKTELIQDLDLQTNAPKIDVPDNKQYCVPQNDQENYWIDTTDYSVYEGTFTGGEVYHAEYRLEAKYGYIFNNEDDIKVTIHNGSLVSKEADRMMGYISVAGFGWRSNFYIEADVTAVHDLGKTPAVPATCIAGGCREYYTCSTCSKVFSDAEGKNETTADAMKTTATGIHTWDAGKITKEATETEEGVKTYTCTVCGLTRTEAVAKKTTGTSTDPATQMGADGTPVGEGASYEAAEKAITGMTSDNDPKGAVYNILQAKASKVTKNSIKLTWKKPSGATQYVIYGNACGKKNKCEKLTTVKNASITFKKLGSKALKKGTYYKFIVVALDKNNKVVSTSKMVHAATSGGKVGNVSKVTTKAKKNKVTVKVKKKFKLAGKQVAQSKKLKVKNHRKLSYESTNQNVAKVDSKGIITGVSKGSCYVYAYAQNGVSAKIKVTVK